MKSHKDLDVWRLAMDLAQQTYEITRAFPREEQFGLSAQMRRAAVSIPSNIAEGAARQGQKEFAQFLFFSLGSASELETQPEISRRVKLLSDKTHGQLDAMLARIAQMLRGLIGTSKTGESTD
jgi:four helix bundle protein